MKLSENFSLEEFTRSDTATARRIDNTPPPEVVINLTKLAMWLEEVRREVLGGLPMTISSGYRCLALNAAVGGVDSSDHTRGLAADFVCPAFGTPLKIAEAIAASTSLRPAGQLIYEKPKDVPWVHGSIHPAALPENRILTYDRYGFRSGLFEARA